MASRIVMVPRSNPSKPKRRKKHKAPARRKSVAIAKVRSSAVPAGWRRFKIANPSSKRPGELPSAAAAEAWQRAHGRKVPARMTEAWFKMYKAWKQSTHGRLMLGRRANPTRRNPAVRPRRRRPARRRNPSGRYEVYAGSGGGDKVFATNSPDAAKSFSRSLRSKGEQTYVYDTETRKASRPNPSKRRKSRFDVLEPPPPLPASYAPRNPPWSDKQRDQWRKERLALERNFRLTNPSKRRRRSRARSHVAPLGESARNDLRRYVARVLDRDDRLMRGKRASSLSGSALRKSIARGQRHRRVANPSARPSHAKYRAAPRALKAKWERCVQDIKRRKGKKPYSPFAVCTSVMEKKAGKRYHFARANPASYKRTYSRKGQKVTVSQLPEAQIEWVVDRFHVGTPDAEIAADIDRRTKAWPEAMRKKAVAYALKVHADNQRLYRSVMTGRFNPSRRTKRKSRR